MYNPNSQELCPETEGLQSTAAVPDPDPASLVFVPETQTQSPSEYTEFSELMYNPNSQELCPETEGLQSTAAVPDPDPARQVLFLKPKPIATEYTESAS